MLTNLTDQPAILNLRFPLTFYHKYRPHRMHDGHSKINWGRKKENKCKVVLKEMHLPDLRIPLLWLCIY